MAEYSEDLAIEICRRIAEGESLTKVAKADGMPSTSTVYRWLRDKEDFAKLMRLAHSDQAHTRFNEAIEIADEAPPMFVDDKGIRRIDPAGVQQQRLRVDTRKWAAAKLMPKVYGERIELTGAAGQPLMPRPEPVDQLELARRVAFLLAAAADAEAIQAKPLQLPAPLKTFATAEQDAEIAP